MCVYTLHCNFILLFFVFVLAISSKDEDDVGNKFRCNGYSEEFLDRIEPNGNILRAKQHSSTSDARIGKWLSNTPCILHFFFL
jgi:hypothetical protein